MKFPNKAEFVRRTNEQWLLLWEAVEKCPNNQKSQQKLKQVLAHLHAWHRLSLVWYKEGLKGQPVLPAQGFNWGQTRSLNAKLDREFNDLPLPSVIRRLKLSHGRVMKVIDGLNEKQLLQSGAFTWTGKNALISYLAPNTFSHYRWAIKKLRKA